MKLCDQVRVNARLSYTNEHTRRIHFKWITNRRGCVHYCFSSSQVLSDDQIIISFTRFPYLCCKLVIFQLYWNVTIFTFVVSEQGIYVIDDQCLLSNKWLAVPFQSCDCRMVLSRICYCRTVHIIEPFAVERYTIRTHCAVHVPSKAGLSWKIVELFWIKWSLTITDYIYTYFIADTQNI